MTQSKHLHGRMSERFSLLIMASGFHRQGKTDSGNLQWRRNYWQALSLVVSTLTQTSVSRVDFLGPWVGTRNVVPCARIPVFTAPVIWAWWGASGRSSLQAAKTNAVIMRALSRLLLAQLQTVSRPLSTCRLLCVSVAAPQARVLTDSLTVSQRLLITLPSWDNAQDHRRL